MIKFAAALALSLALTATSQTPSGSETIGGRTLRAENGQPVAGARISLRAEVQTDAASLVAVAPLTRTTDTNGAFEFGGVVAGRYVLSVNANGFARQTYGPVSVDASHNLKGLTFRLTREAVVSGRVQSDEGVINGMDVFLAQSSYDANGRKTLAAVATARSNDRGEYRLFGVPPGRYYLITRSREAWNLARSPFITEQVRTAYTTLYYPGTTDLSKAELLDLKSGTESKADLNVQRLKTYFVRGRVQGIQTEGTPAAPPSLSGLTLVADERVGNTGSTYGISARSNGTFEFEDVPPGQYTLVGVFPLRTSSTMDSPVPAQFALARLEVRNGNVENISLPFAPLVRVLGRLSIEGAPNADLSTLASFQAELIRSRRSPEIPLAPVKITRFHTPVTAGGAFTYDGVVPGEYELRVHGLPPNMYVKQATFGARDAMSAPIRVVDRPDPLDIVIRTKAGQIEGNILEWQSNPTATTDVVLIPNQARDQINLYRHALVDASGRFKIGSIPPGDYRLFVWQDVPQYSWFDPEFVREFEQRATPVRVSESSIQKLEVRR